MTYLFGLYWTVLSQANKHSPYLMVKAEKLELPNPY